MRAHTCVFVKEWLLGARWMEGRRSRIYLVEREKKDVGSTLLSFFHYRKPLRCNNEGHWRWYHFVIQHRNPLFSFFFYLSSHSPSIQMRITKGPTLLNSLLSSGGSAALIESMLISHLFGSDTHCWVNSPLSRFLRLLFLLQTRLMSTGE